MNEQARIRRRELGQLSKQQLIELLIENEHEPQHFVYRHDGRRIRCTVPSKEND